MPYLNWKSASLGQEKTAHSRLQTQIRLVLSGADIETLVGHLRDVFGGEGGELRVDLPRKWILFWKRRETESRLLVAHPQPEEWVTTIALDQAHGEKLIDSLGRLEGSQEVSISELGTVGSVSNVELVLSRAS